MKSISKDSVGIQQGRLILFSDFADGGAMWTGQGPREVRRQVEFKVAFQDPPVVMPSLSMWDMDHRSNGRMDVSVDDVTSHGFTLVFKTWGDTRIARVRADWTAIGAVKDADQWVID